MLDRGTARLKVEAVNNLGVFHELKKAMMPSKKLVVGESENSKYNVIKWGRTQLAHQTRPHSMKFRASPLKIQCLHLFSK